jgi:hypothetical protein
VKSRGGRFSVLIVHFMNSGVIDQTLQVIGKSFVRLTIRHNGRRSDSVPGFSSQQSALSSVEPYLHQPSLTVSLEPGIFDRSQMADKKIKQRAGRNVPEFSLNFSISVISVISVLAC